MGIFILLLAFLSLRMRLNSSRNKLIRISRPSLVRDFFKLLIIIILIIIYYLNHYKLIIFSPFSLFNLKVLHENLFLLPEFGLLVYWAIGIWAIGKLQKTAMVQPENNS